MLTSDNTAANHSGERVASDLVLRCMDRSLDVMVWSGSSHFRSPQPITARNGSDPSVTLDWGTSSDGEWAFHPAPRAFIDALAGGDRLELSLEPMDAPDASYDFELAGLTEIIGLLETDCPRT
jgi:hypothetical protein